MRNVRPAAIMDVTFEATEQDVALVIALAGADVRNHVNKRWSVRLLGLTAGAAVFIAMMMLFGFMSKYSDSARVDAAWVFWPAVGGLILLGAYAKQYRTAMRTYCVGAFGPYPVPQRVTLDATCIRIESPNGASSFNWSHLKDLRTLDEHFAIFFRPTSVMVVPYRAFADSNKKAAFHDDIKRRMRA